jgi:prephenate dehydrogenase
MNRKSLLASVDGFTASLAVLREMIESGDSQGLAEFFTTAKQFRDGIL